MTNLKIRKTSLVSKILFILYRKFLQIFDLNFKQSLEEIATEAWDDVIESFCRSVKVVS